MSDAGSIYSAIAVLRRSTSLETALRSYSALTKNDIIEIEYNSIHFELLIMETNPEGSGISVIDTDLEVNSLPALQNAYALI